MIQSEVVTATDARAAITVPARTDSDNSFHVEITNTDAALSVTLGGDDIVFGAGGRTVLFGETWYSQSPLSPSDVLYAVTASGTTVSLDLLWVSV